MQVLPVVSPKADLAVYSAISPTHLIHNIRIFDIYFCCSPVAYSGQPGVLQVSNTDVARPRQTSMQTWFQVVQGNTCLPSLARKHAPAGAPDGHCLHHANY